MQYLNSVSERRVVVTTQRIFVLCYRLLPSQNGDMTRKAALAVMVIEDLMIYLLSYGSFGKRD